MSKKNNKGKLTRKDITEALEFIGRKLRFLEELAVAQENILDAYINMNKDKDKFMKYLEEKFPKKEQGDTDGDAKKELAKEEG